jgi:predicted TIM-barrel fold metal-dependent hydrolase
MKNNSPKECAVTRVIDFRVRLPNSLRPRIESPPELREQYDNVLDISAKIDQTLEDLIAQMDATGVEHAVMHAEYEHGDIADALNESLAGVVTDHPDRFTGIGTITTAPMHIMRAVKQVQQCKDYGFIGICVESSFYRLGINDKALYPIYAKAAELNLMVAVHTGVNYGVTHPIRNDHPLQLDDVCCDFPELTMIACHAGWPWATEMVAVARKHPNVYLEFGGLAPRYVGEAGTGWEVVRRFMNNLLKRQVLFGTDWPVIALERALDEWRAMGLKDDVLDGLLGGNAQRLIDLHK